MGARGYMQPNTPNNQNDAPPPLTGSQLEEQAAADSWQKTRKKLKIGIGIGASALLVLAAFVVFALLTTKPNTSEVAIKTNNSGKTIAPSPAQAPVAPAASPYADFDYSAINGQSFKLKYFSNAQKKQYCELALHPQCLPPVPSTVYLSGSKDNRPPLLFSVEDASTNSQPDYCPAVAFTVTLNSKNTNVCKQDLGGRVFQYTFTFTIKGVEYVGTFIMDNPVSGTFIDASQYEKDIKEFVPALRVYL
jgi:hypothetical protein